MPEDTRGIIWPVLSDPSEQHDGRLCHLFDQTRSGSDPLSLIHLRTVSLIVVVSLIVWNWLKGAYHAIIIYILPLSSTYNVSKSFVVKYHMYVINL